MYWSRTCNTWPQLGTLILPRVSPWGWPEGLAHNLQIPLQVFNKIQDFYNKCSTKYKISTYKTLFQASECYSPTSSQAKVLVVQATVAAYLQDLPSRLFSNDSLNARKGRNYYWQATYKDNFSRVLNQKFPFFWFTSSGFCKQPILFEVLAPASLVSTRKAYAKGVPENNYLTQQKQYQQRTTLRTWPW